VIEMGLSVDDYRVCQWVAGPATRMLAPGKFEVDFSSPSSLHEAHCLMVGAAGEPVGGIINLMPLEPRYSDPKSADEAQALELAMATFHLVKEFSDDLRRSAAEGGGWLVNFTSLNGKFGIDSDSPLPLAQAGTLGILKAAGKELAGVRVKTIDLDPQMDPQDLLEGIAAELTAEAPEVEVGYNAQGRWTLELRDAPVSPAGTQLDIASHSVILVTGGAYGITAEVCKALARAYSPTLILVGRSPLPVNEPAELRELRDAAALRKYLIASMQRTGQAMTPADIEHRVRAILKSRQIRDNLAELRRLATTVEYHAVDVRDVEQFGNLLDDIYQRHDRIDGVIHGAGVIEDKLIRDKSPESFANVFSTKVSSAVTLTRKLRSESLKFLIFFSSVSGRFGNMGQSDYSAANEYLNKLAQHLDQSWPGRVVSIGWGPWDAGMVSDQLRLLYKERGIDLIPLGEGVKAFISELQLVGQNPPEVVITCSARQIANALAVAP
jgi:NAD(P)-dependent dehydrogenase (short-subunit alcohol dehydrogenase family)